MKKRLFPLLLSVFIILPLTWSCDPYERVDFSGQADNGYEGFKSDAELFLEFAYRKQSIVLNFLNYTSDGFKKEPLKDEVTKDEFEKFFFEIEEFNKNAGNYEQAIRRIEQSNVLFSPTKARAKNSITDFFTWALGTGKRNRNRVITVSSNLSSSDRSKLYDELRPGLKSKTSNEADFWDKLQKGDLDNAAGQIYNDFYHNAETDFFDLAQEKGLTPGKIVVKEGADGLEVGSAIIIDAATDVIPGFSIGKTIVTVADNTEKMAKSNTWSEAASHGMKSVGEVISELGDQLEINPIRLSGETIKNTMDLLEMAEYKEKSGDETKGKVNVKDKNTKEPAKIVIATRTDVNNENDQRSSIYVTTKNKVSKGIDLIIKAGSWMITTINESGKRETTMVEVKKGETLGVTINTKGELIKDEPESEIILSFTASLKGYHDLGSSDVLVNASFDVMNTKLTGKDTKYTGTAIEDVDAHGVKSLKTTDIQLVFDKAKNPTKVVSIKGSGTTTAYFNDKLASITKFKWEIGEIPLAKFPDRTMINGNNVCKYIIEFNESFGLSESTENDIFLKDLFCDSESLLWMNIELL